MSKYSRKMEKQKAKLKTEKRKEEEKSMLQRNFNRINRIEKREKEKEDKIIEHRRRLRKRFLESLNVGDIKLIESARQSMLNYEIGLKLEQQENEREVWC